jgi:acetyl-CoA carboxylase carboxyltransferase component
MGGSQAAKTLLQIQVSSLKSQGKTIAPEEEKAMLDKITESYNAQTQPMYAAARLWVDGIIHPLETRKIISMGIEMANHAPITRPFQLGVIQT